MLSTDEGCRDCDEFGGDRAEPAGPPAAALRGKVAAVSQKLWVIVALAALLGIWGPLWKRSVCAAVAARLAKIDANDGLAIVHITGTGCLRFTLMRRHVCYWLALP